MGLGEIGVAQSLLDKNFCFSSLFLKKQKTDMIMSGPVPKKRASTPTTTTTTTKIFCRCRTVRNSIANEKKIVNKTVYKGPRTFKRKYSILKLGGRRERDKKTQSVVVKKKMSNRKVLDVSFFFQRRSVNA